MAIDPDSLKQKNLRVLRNTLFIVLGMFGFGFALVPLYDVFCEVTGLNGKTAGAYTGDTSVLARDEERSVRIQFMTVNNENMPWDFRPTLHEVRVIPGEPTDIDFYARNPTTHAMVAQAVPSVAPSAGAEYFLKTECFCFEQQPLEAGQEVLMRVRFLVDANLPKDIHTLTLSYTLFDITESQTKTKT